MRETNFEATVARFEFPWRTGGESNLSGIARKPEENSGLRGDTLPVSQKSCFPAPPRDPSEKLTFIANANRRDWFVRIQNRFCYRIDMLGELRDRKRNRCAKRFLRRRSLVLSSLAGNLWIRFAALGEPWLSGAFPGFTKFVQDRTQTRRKLKVQG